MLLNEFILKCNALKKNVSETIDELRVLLSPEPHGINRVYELMKDLKNILYPKTVLSENEKDLLNDLKGLFSEESNPHYRENMILKLIDMQQEFYSGLIPERKTKELFRSGFSSSIITQTNIISSPLHEKYLPTELGEVSVPEYAKLVAKSYMKTPDWKRYFYDEWAYAFSNHEYILLLTSFQDSLVSFLNFFDLDDLAENSNGVTYNLKKCYEQILKETTICMSRFCPLETNEFGNKIHKKLNLFHGFDKQKFLEIFEEHNKYHGLYLKDVYNKPTKNTSSEDALNEKIRKIIEKINHFRSTHEFSYFANKHPDLSDKISTLTRLYELDPNNKEIPDKAEEINKIIYGCRFDSKYLTTIGNSLLFPTVMYVPLFVDGNKKSIQDIEKFIEIDFISHISPFFSKGIQTQRFWPHLFICIFKATDRETYEDIEEKIYRSLDENDVTNYCTVLSLNI